MAAFPAKCLSGRGGGDGGGDGDGGDDGPPTRQEHVQHARASAAFVARDIVAQAAAATPPAPPAPPAPSYSYLPYYYSRVFDLGWVFYGSQSTQSVVEFGERDAEAAALRGEKQTFGTFHLAEVEGGGKERKIVGAFLEGGSPDQNNAVKKLVEAGAVVEDAGEGGSALGMEWAISKAAKL